MSESPKNTATGQDLINVMNWNGSIDWEALKKAVDAPLDKEGEWRKKQIKKLDHLDQETINALFHILEQRKALALDVRSNTEEDGGINRVPLQTETLEMADGRPIHVEQTQEKHRVKARRGLNYRTVPTKENNTPLGALPNGTEVQVIGIVTSHPGWVKVQMPGGQEGFAYMSSRYTEKVEDHPIPVPPPRRVIKSVAPEPASTAEQEEQSGGSIIAASEQTIAEGASNGLTLEQHPNPGDVIEVTLPLIAPSERVPSSEVIQTAADPASVETQTGIEEGGDEIETQAEAGSAGVEQQVGVAQKGGTEMETKEAQEAPPSGLQVNVPSKEAPTQPNDPPLESFPERDTSSEPEPKPDQQAGDQVDTNGIVGNSKNWLTRKGRALWGALKRMTGNE